MNLPGVLAINRFEIARASRNPLPVTPADAGVPPRAGSDRHLHPGRSERR